MPPNICELFPGHALFPVIRTRIAKMAIGDMKVAIDSGAQGVFLAPHQVTWDYFLQICEWICKDHPDFFIGVDLCAHDVRRAFEIVPECVCAVWVADPSFQDMNNPRAEELAKENRKIIEGRINPPIYFGSIAFRNHEMRGHIVAAAVHAARCMDVIVTSGNTADSPPLPEKIALMHQEVPNMPIALAARVTPEQTKPYRKCVKFLLVGESVRKSSGYKLDPSKVRAFAQAWC